MNETRKPPIGSRPGTLAIDPRAPRPRLQVTVYDESSIEQLELQTADQIRGLLDGRRKLWVDVQGLGDEQVLRDLAEIFRIHPLALEDVVHVPIRPKAEPYEKNLLIISRMLRVAGDRAIDTEQIGIILGRDYVLTFQEAYGDVLDPVRKRLQLPTAMMRRSSSDYLAYVILDTIIDAYFPVVEALGDRIEGLEERVFRAAGPEVLREMMEIKNSLVGLRRAVVPQRDAVNTLIRQEGGFVGPNVRVYLRDTYDHIVQTSEALETARELINGLMNTYLSVVSNRMNEVMKTLTVVASIFVPLTFLAGIYGMNFEHMPELHVRWAYPLLLGTMGATAGLMVIYFWRKGWVARRD